MEELKPYFQLALSGREVWIRLKETYKINEYCFLVLCPSDEILLNKAAMENLDEFLKRKYIKRAVVVSIYTDIRRLCEDSKQAEIQFVCISQEEMEGILKYYRLTQFTQNIVVISLEEPFGNGNIIGKEGITLEDYVRNAIYV